MDGSTRQAKLGDRITCHYRLVCSGQEVANTFPDAPETFTLGAGEIDHRLESLILGLSSGEHHTYELMPEQAFGLRDESLVQTLPRADFASHDEIEVGKSVEFALPNGSTLIGHILSLDTGRVVLDFNHPLAGLPIEFEIALLSITEE